MYDYNTNTCSSGQQCGHYTQIVWADTLRIGCAEPTTVTCSGPYGSRFYVCDYAPGGNYVGEKPYVSGSGPNASCE